MCIRDRYKSLLRPGGLPELCRELSKFVRRRVAGPAAGAIRRMGRVSREAEASGDDGPVGAGAPASSRSTPAASDGGSRPARRQAEGTAVPPAGTVPDQALDHEPRRLDLPVVFYRASGSKPGHTSARWRDVAPVFDEVVVKGRHRGFNSIMDADRVGGITADIERRLR